MSTPTDTPETKRRLLFALAAGVLALIVAITVVPGPRSTAEASDVDPQTRATFGLFDRPRTEGDDIPGDAGSASSFEVDRQPGENRAQSRRVDLPDGAAYAWPMDGGVCTSWGNCVSTAFVAGAGVAVSSDAVVEAGTLQSLRLSGLVRNGIASVRFTMPGGADDIVVDVRDNLFSRAFPAAPTGMYWTDGEGRHQDDPSLPQLIGSTGS